MNKSFLSRLVLAGSLLLLLSPLQKQKKNIYTIKYIQITANEFCAVIEVNASWNWENKIPLEKLENCYIAYVDLSNKQIGAVIQKEWDIRVVPTIIIFEYGKEVKRFEADLSMKFREDEILNKIRQEIRK
jgi:thiol-disulfide isomerase/thioredoxin